MELTSPSVKPAVEKHGHDKVSIPAGQVLRIETTPGGKEILDYTVPAGKVAQASIHVTIKEEDEA